MASHFEAKPDEFFAPAPDDLKDAATSVPKMALMPTRAAVSVVANKLGPWELRLKLAVMEADRPEEVTRLLEPAKNCCRGNLLEGGQQGLQQNGVLPAGRHVGTPHG